MPNFESIPFALSVVMLNVIMLSVMAPQSVVILCEEQWEAINRKQITRWQHVSQLKASSFGSR